ncbi:glycosyltransferase involved in cell wall biosynthesis [Flavobacterium sp. 2755]|nr:glycosyltransferase involved in cell wall biosynthesis [Flavobacterium sp. 2755]
MNGNYMQKTVSVNMITYKHESYIEQAIKGILMQQTDFDYELIIADDCSPDRTEEIVNDLIKTHSQGSKIKYFRHKKNIGMQANGIFAFNQCSGKYVALCEGDDYWTDPLKLQKQVDFLEANLDYSICYHKVQVLRNGVLEEDDITSEVSETTTIKDLAKGNYIHTCSVVFRNKLFSKLPKYFHKAPVGDYFLHMLNAKYGKIKFLNEFMSVYRLHDNSIWSSQTQLKREEIWIDFLKNIRKNFDSDVQEILNDQIKKYGGSVEKEKVFDFNQFKKIFKKLLKKIRSDK